MLRARQGLLLLSQDIVAQEKNVMLRLVMRRGPTPGAVFELTQPDLTVGRGSKNHIVIRDNDVSREHCRLVRSGDTDTYVIHDLSSTNATFLNGMRVSSPMQIRPGSLIELGDMITLLVEQTPDAPAASTARVTSEAQAVDAPIPARLPVEEYRYGLKVMTGPSTGQVFWLENLIIEIGRDLNNEIVIQDPEVSRRHLRLRRYKQGYSVEDLASTNGTFINGEPLTTVQLLHPNDVLRLGTRVQLQALRVHADEDLNQTNTAPVLPAASARNLGRTSLLNRIAQAPNAPPRASTGDDTVDEVRRRPVEPSSAGTGLDVGALRDHVFLSYARGDWDTLVAPLTMSLQDAGLPCWVDQYLVPGSGDWLAAVEQAWTECWVMVLVLSKEAIESPHVRTEYRHFMKRGKPLITVLGEDHLRMPEDLRLSRVIVADPRDLSRTFHKLIYEIVQIRNGSS
jgi:pSer/pThr/pTyr-binding forkhead associated (FHA) protein